MKCKKGYEKDGKRCIQKNTYYIGNTSIFNTPPYYQKEKIKRAVISGGGRQVRLARQFGRSNQPQVVVFKIKNAKNVESRVEDIRNTVSEELWGTDRKWRNVLIYEKDW